MDERVYIVATIIVLAGLLGGYGSYLTEPVVEAVNPEPTSRKLRRSLLLGVLAAACVPLFLSLVQSGLIGNIFAAAANPPRPPAFEDYLIFTGLCIIAALSSRRFIDSITRQVLQRIDDAEEAANAASVAAAEAQKIAEEAKEEAELGEAADEPDAAPPPEALRVGTSEERVEATDNALTDAERRILHALALRTYRTRTGIAEDSGIPKNKISEYLELLADRKLALPTTSPRTGGARWIITRRGLSAIDLSR